MIQVNLPNVVTIALCGALGYALVLGIQAMQAQIKANGATAS